MSSPGPQAYMLLPGNEPITSHTQRRRYTTERRPLPLKWKEFYEARKSENHCGSRVCNLGRFLQLNCTVSYQSSCSRMSYPLERRGQDLCTKHLFQISPKGTSWKVWLSHFKIISTESWAAIWEKMRLQRWLYFKISATLVIHALPHVFALCSCPFLWTVHFLHFWKPVL